MNKGLSLVTVYMCSILIGSEYADISFSYTGGSGVVKPYVELYYAEEQLNHNLLALSQDYVAYPGSDSAKSVFFKERTQNDQLTKLQGSSESEIKQLCFNSNQSALFSVCNDGINILYGSPFQMNKSDFKTEIKHPCKNYIATHPYDAHTYIFTKGNNILYDSSIESKYLHYLFSYNDPFSILNIGYMNNIIYCYSQNREKKEICFYDPRKKELFENCLQFNEQDSFISCMAYHPTKTLFAYSREGYIILTDVKKSSCLVLATFLWIGILQELFFVGDTLVVITNDRVSFFDTISNNLVETIRIKRSIAKWHPHIQTLSVHNKKNGETVLYEFPFNQKTLERIHNFSLFKNTELEEQNKQKKQSAHIQTLWEFLVKKDAIKEYIQQESTSIIKSALQEIEKSLCSTDALAKQRIILALKSKEFYNEVEKIAFSIESKSYEEFKKNINVGGTIECIINLLQNKDLLAKCTACFEAFKEQSSYGKTKSSILLPCAHIICAACKEKLKQQKCPLCQKDI